MTILQELVALYERRADGMKWPRPGFSTERIGVEVVIRDDGSVAEIRSLMREGAKGRKMEARPLLVPLPPPNRRGLKLVSGNLWDPMPYALGVSGSIDSPQTEADRAREKFRAFKTHHKEILEGENDPALKALLAFVEAWNPETAVTLGLGPYVGQNVVFTYEPDSHLTDDSQFIHLRPAARALLAPKGDGAAQMCLVTGRSGAVARLHPTIRGVAGAQSSGASLVSFNDDAYESHGKSQGDNAPVSEAAAFAYGTALNALLAKGSPNVLRVGDAPVAFWSAAEAPAEAEALFAAMFEGVPEMPDRAEEEVRLRDRLKELRDGRAPRGMDPAAPFFVLGLAPNAARLSVRFWMRATFGDVAANVSEFWRDCAISPSPFRKGDADQPPRPWALLYDIAAQRDAGNVPPNLGGDLMRAILSGAPFPAPLLAAVINRLRAEGDPDPKAGPLDGRRAALVRAVLTRNHRQEVPMALDEAATDVAYLLGRLFAAFAYAEQSYQKRGASLRSKYMGSASATPARVFPVLMRGYEHNAASLSKAGDRRTGSGIKADRAVTAIIAALPGDRDLPAALPLEEQGRFFIGFYHQWSAFFARSDEAADALIETTEAEESPA